MSDPRFSVGGGPEIHWRLGLLSGGVVVGGSFQPLMGLDLEDGAARSQRRRGLENWGRFCSVVVGWSEAASGRLSGAVWWFQAVGGPGSLVGGECGSGA